MTACMPFFHGGQGLIIEWNKEHKTYLDEMHA
jgi:hypothetical protein